MAKRVIAPIMDKVTIKFSDGEEMCQLGSKLNGCIVSCIEWAKVGTPSWNVYDKDHNLLSTFSAGMDAYNVEYVAKKVSKTSILSMQGTQVLCNKLKTRYPIDRDSLESLVWAASESVQKMGPDYSRYGLMDMVDRHVETLYLQKKEGEMI